MARHCIISSSSSRQQRLARCEDCCDHGVALVWFCDWCAELDEFGSSDFGVWGPELVLPCEHVARDQAPLAQAS